MERPRRPGWQAVARTKTAAPIIHAGVPHAGEPAERAGRDAEAQPAGAQPLAHVVDLHADDLRDLRALQPVEEHDLVEPVDELGRQVLRHRLEYLGARLLGLRALGQRGGQCSLLLPDEPRQGPRVGAVLRQVLAEGLRRGVPPDRQGVQALHPIILGLPRGPHALRPALAVAVWRDTACR